MAARKMLLLLALALVAITAAATAVAAQDTDDATEVVETFVGEKTSPPTEERVPVPKPRCLIRYCGVRSFLGRCVSYYHWYGAINYRIGSTTPDGGRTVRACVRVRWCPGCYVCRTAKWSSCKRSYPFFTKLRLCPRPRLAAVSSRTATTEWST